MADEAVRVVQSFVKAINGADLKLMRELMSKDHVFVDAEGRESAGADRMIIAWRAFFESYPEYWIMIDRCFTEGDEVALFGEAGGRWSVAGKTLPASWRVRSAWLATVEAGRVKRWSVFSDTSWSYPPQNLSAEAVS